MAMGVNPNDYKGQSKRGAANLIVDRAQENLDLISQVLEMSKRGQWNQNYYGEALTEIDSALRISMNSSLDQLGHIVPFLPGGAVRELEPPLVRRMRAAGCDQASEAFLEAFSTFGKSPKGALSLLRTCYESLAEDVIRLLGEQPPKRFFDKLLVLQQSGLLNSIDPRACSHCGRRNRDVELNLAYDHYNMLSHYGSHPGRLTDDETRTVFQSTTSVIELLVGRLEKRKPHPAS